MSTEIPEKQMHVEYYGVDVNSYQIPSDIMSKILNASIHSLKIDSITAINENGGRTHFDPLIHIIIGGQPGSFKSTIMKEVIKRVGGVNISLLTAPNLLGSVDKQGEFTEPLLWQARGGILGIDDWSPNFHAGKDNKYFDVLLKFLEDYSYTRKFSFKTRDFEINEDEHSSMVMKDSILNTRCRSVLIANTMRNFVKKKEKMVSFEALLSRCFYFPFNPPRQSVRDYMDCKIKFFTYKKIPVKKKVVISKKDYRIIKDYVFSKELNLSDTTRGVGLFVRLFAVYGFHDYELYDEIIKIKRLRG